MPPDRDAEFDQYDDTTRKRRGLGAWRAALRALIIVPLAVAALAWIVSDRLWVADLVAQASGHVAAAAAVAAIWWAVCRRWVASAVTAAVFVAALWPLVVGRALFVNPGAGTSTTGGPVRVLVYNALASNEGQAGVRDTILSSGADIVALLEAPAWLIDELRAGDAWRDRYPHYFVSDRAGAGFKVVLTKWPQHSVEDRRRGAQRTLVAGSRQMLLARPQGVFAFTLVHPRSPRTAERWREGNGLIAKFVERHRTVVRPLGAPHVAAGDLNATPTGARTRALAAGGFQRAKPLFAFAGTIPSWLPWPLAIAIDDVLVSESVDVLSWSAVDGGGSDHCAVIADVWVPAPATPIELPD